MVSVMPIVGESDVLLRGGAGTHRWQLGARIENWKSDYLEAISDGAIEVLTRPLDSITSPLSDFKIASWVGLPLECPTTLP